MEKPRGKATDPCINATGILTLLLQPGGKRRCRSPLETRTDSPVETPEVPPKSMVALERNPQVLALTAHKALGPGTNWRGIPRGPLQLAWSLAFPEATRTGPLGLHHNSIGTCCSSRKSRRFSPPGEMRPLAATQEVPRHTRLHSRGTGKSRPHPEEPRFRLIAREV